MKLSQLTMNMPELIQLTGDIEIGALTANSREKCENGLFFCIRGGTVDAHNFAPQAIENGCCALVVERLLELNKKLEKNFKKTGVTAVTDYPTEWTTNYE